MGSHRLQTVNKRGNYNPAITCSQTMMFSPYVNKSIFTHGNKVYMIANKKSLFNKIVEKYWVW